MCFRSCFKPFTFIYTQNLNVMLFLILSSTLFTHYTFLKVPSRDKALSAQITSKVVLHNVSSDYTFAQVYGKALIEFSCKSLKILTQACR